MVDGGPLKLGRARAHIIEAREIARTWLDSDAFTIARTTDHSTGRTEARVRLQGSPPDQLALAVGDAIHKLRAGLDQRTAAQLPHVPADVRQVIEEAQPYHWSDATFPDGSPFHPLWRAHDLDRIDKHRRLTVMAASLGHHAIGVPKGVEPDVQFHVASGAVRDGQVLATYLGADAGVEYLFDRNVILAESGIPEDAAVVSTLEGFLRHVEWVVRRLNTASRSQRAPRIS